MPGDFTAVAFAGDSTYPASSSRGLLTVFYSNTWGTVCDDFILSDPIGADIVCRQLGWHTRVPNGKFYQPSIVYSSPNSMGSNDAYGPIMLDDILCAGHEGSLDQCHHRSWFTNNCNHQEDVVVECISDVDRTLSITALQHTVLIEGTRIFTEALITPPVMNANGWQVSVLCGYTLSSGDRTSWNLFQKLIIPSGGSTSGPTMFPVPVGSSGNMIIRNVSCSLQYDLGDSSYSRLTPADLTFELVPASFTAFKSGLPLRMAAGTTSDITITTNTPPITFDVTVEPVCRSRDGAGAVIAGLFASNIIVPIGSTSGFLPITAPSGSTYTALFPNAGDNLVVCTFTSMYLSGGESRWIGKATTLRFTIDPTIDLFLSSFPTIMLVSTSTTLTISSNVAIATGSSLVLGLSCISNGATLLTQVAIIPAGASQVTLQISAPAVATAQVTCTVTRTSGDARFAAISKIFSFAVVIADVVLLGTFPSSVVVNSFIPLTFASSVPVATDSSLMLSLQCTGLINTPVTIVGSVSQVTMQIQAPAAVSNVTCVLSYASGDNRFAGIAAKTYLFSVTAGSVAKSSSSSSSTGRVSSSSNSSSSTAAAAAAESATNSSSSTGATSGSLTSTGADTKGCGLTCAGFAQAQASWILAAVVAIVAIVATTINN